MRPVTAVAVAAVLATLGAAVGIAIFGPPGVAAGSVSLEERWISDTARDGDVNHHAPAADLVDGRPMVVAPISDGSEERSCSLVALNAHTAVEAWNHTVPEEDCTIHAVADPTIADYDDDGNADVLVATTENVLYAFDARTGEPSLRYELDAYGYTEPVVRDLTRDGTKEIVTVDARGTTHAIRPNGSALWTRELDAYVWATPIVTDFDADGAPELAVGGEGGAMALLDANGSTLWSDPSGVSDAITTMSAGNVDDDPAVELVATSRGGQVFAVDGTTGDVQWTSDVAAYPAVGGMADIDGAPTVFVTARDGRLRALDATSGDRRWTTTLTTEDVQMTPAPRLGDLDGDGDPELVAVTLDGLVTVVDPSSGDVLDTYRRSGAIRTPAELADVDGDGAAEAFVLYGDGRVVALSHDADE